MPNKILGLTPDDSKDVLETLLKLKFTPPYAGSIRTVSAHEFFFIYIIPQQISVLKEYARLNRHSYELSDDSTGSLVIPLKVYEFMPPTPHIFLHELVINFNNQIVPVGQMLSADQSTPVIEFFLKQFLKAGAPIPKKSSLWL